MDGPGHRAGDDDLPSGFRFGRCCRCCAHDAAPLCLGLGLTPACLTASRPNISITRSVITRYQVERMSNAGTDVAKAGRQTNQHLESVVAEAEQRYVAAN